MSALRHLVSLMGLHFPFIRAGVDFGPGVALPGLSWLQSLRPEPAGAVCVTVVPNILHDSQVGM